MEKQKENFEYTIPFKFHTSYNNAGPGVEHNPTWAQSSYPLNANLVAIHRDGEA